MSRFLKVELDDNVYYKISSTRKDDIHACSQIVMQLWPEICENQNIDCLAFIEDSNTKKLFLCVYFKSGSNFIGPELEDDFSNASGVINEIIYKMNDLNPEPFNEDDYYSGPFHGKTIKFRRSFAGYRFSDEECNALLNGENIIVSPLDKNGNMYRCFGRLELQEYMNFKYYGFKWNKNVKLAPTSFCGVEFTEKQLKAFDAGATMNIKNLYSKKNNRYFSAPIRFNRYTGKYEIVQERK